jgi:hypothetical protein
MTTTQPASSLLGTYQGDGEQLPPSKMLNSRRILLPVMMIICLTLGFSAISAWLQMDDLRPEITGYNDQTSACMDEFTRQSGFMSDEEYNTGYQNCLELTPTPSWSSLFGSELVKFFFAIGLGNVLASLFLNFHGYRAQLLWSATPTEANYWQSNYKLRVACSKPHTDVEFKNLINQAVSADEALRSKYVAEQTEEFFLELLNDYGVEKPHPLRRLKVKDYIDTPSMPSGPPQD